MANYHLRDKSLSLKAKGLLSLMLSLPDDWDYTTKGLAHICKDGVDSICATVRELEQHGYIRRRRIRNGKGQLARSSTPSLNSRIRPPWGLSLNGKIQFWISQFWVSLNRQNLNRKIPHN